MHTTQLGYAYRGGFPLPRWDFETFGEHHRVDSVSLILCEHYPRNLPIEVWNFNSEQVDRTLQQCCCAYHLPLPIYPTTWAGKGSMEFFLGNSAQQHIFQLMSQIYGMAN